VSDLASDRADKHSNHVGKQADVVSLRVEHGSSTSEHEGISWSHSLTYKFTHPACGDSVLTRVSARSGVERGCHSIYSREGYSQTA